MSNRFKVHSRIKYNNPDNKPLRLKVNLINTAENPVMRITGTIIPHLTKNRTARGNKAAQCNRSKALLDKHNKHLQPMVNPTNMVENPVMRIMATIIRRSKKSKTIKINRVARFK